MAATTTTIVKKKQVRGGKGKTKAQRGNVARPFRVCPVQTAVSILMNNQILRTETKGALSHSSVDYPPSVIEAARGLFPAGKEYDFEIHASATLATNGAGVINQTVSWNPAVTTFSEWSALAALFDEVKLALAHLDVTSAFGPTSTAIITQIIVAPDFTTASGGAPNFPVVQRIAESEVIHCAWMGRDVGRFSKTTRVPDRDWATTSSPGGTSGMIAGCLGHWAFAANMAGTVSINYLFVALRHMVRLRMRA